MSEESDTTSLRIGNMTTDLIHDRGRGPEISGTRITVYSLLPHFLQPEDTESYICKLYDLTPEEVAAARAYVLNNVDSVLARHLQIEDRIAAGNPPELIDQAKKTHETFLRFKRWLDQRETANGRQDVADSSSQSGSTATGFPTFRQWVAGTDAPAVERP